MTIKIEYSQGIFDEEDTSTKDTLIADWEFCKRCELYKTRKGNVVVGCRFKNGDEPLVNYGGRVVCIGQWPGSTEYRTGFPMTGREGITARKWICPLEKHGEKNEYTGIHPHDIFWTNVLGCTPKNEAGFISFKHEYASACMPRVRSIINIVNPSMIILMGIVAVGAVLGTKKAKLDDVRRTVHTYNNIATVVIQHPASISRARQIDKKAELEAETNVKEDVKFASQLLKNILTHKK